MQRFARIVSGVLVSAILAAPGMVLAVEPSTDASKPGHSATTQPGKHKGHRESHGKSRQHTTKKKKPEAGASMGTTPTAQPR